MFTTTAADFKLSLTRRVWAWSVISIKLHL